MGKLEKLSSKFSQDMYQDGVKKRLLPAKILLQCVGFWPDDELPYGQIIGWLLFLFLLVPEIFNAAYVVIHCKDISEAVNVSITVTTFFEALVRMYCVLKNRHVLNGILVKVWKQFWPVKCLDDGTRTHFERKSLVCLTMNVCVLLVASFSNTIIVSIPLFNYHQLILKSIFPFDWDKNYLYELIYMWQYFADWYDLFLVMAFDFLFVALLMTCATQCAIWQHVMRNILNETSKEHRRLIFGEMGNQISDKEMLRHCWEQHKLLNNICNDMESIFSITLLLQFIVSTTANCAAALIMKLDSSQITKVSTFSAGHIIQLSYCCYVGQELIYQSEQLSNAIYECNWHLSYDRDFRKSLVLMMQRSQKIQCLTAANLITLDFASFVRIFRLSFSFYTLLDSLVEDPAENGI
ncbi:7tm Odorant receptor [Popillia japonica]|uniref:Odorant receptor n=1 Tax=Popillia japonica TaxID=7064 RepID=A0AAW1IZ09_POPJA